MIRVPKKYDKTEAYLGIINENYSPMAMETIRYMLRLNIFLEDIEEEVVYT